MNLWRRRPRFDLRPAGQHAFQILVAVWAFFSGIGLMVGAPDPKSLNATLSPLLLIVWAACLFVGGMCIIVGAFLKRPVIAMIIEGCGQVSLAVLGFVYAASLILANGVPAAWLSASYVAMFATASAVRTVQIRNDIHRAWKMTVTESQ